eukprot:CAMPEP_0116870608 /NCGR_PEP_ID=MMETSP0463-20121206/581_1 /TAXON_ID=181622 /ORGANISM="Strombidinopsis sp, Strain SopsisLIS2011" /LENGTH=58 /DNA_ID=CAMNT_0004507445 /DNA_START=339 /DNA_END=515 /DNA_ORIENTATION=-
MPQHLRLFVPMFSEMLSQIGTKNYNCHEFANRVISCSDGFDVQLDSYSFADCQQLGLE